MVVSGATPSTTCLTMHSMVCIWLSIPLLQLYLCYTAGATAMDKDTLLILRKIVDSQGKLKDWNASDDSPCGWSHVQCRDGSMNVTGLDLDDMSFVGTVPSILASLRSLESLVLSSNNFSGRIPVFLAFLPHLETLDLSDNSFSGPIPSSLANAKRLKTLRLEGNQLSGSLVRSLTSLNLELLEDLNLSVNRFSGPIPKQISKAQRLKKLQLYSNDLKGTIPSSFSELRSLELLYLFNNSLSGHIPDLTGLQNLTDLDLGYNQLSGQLSGVENLTSMQRFQFRHNFFSGKLPGFDRLKSTVVSLDFSDNLLEGEIPSAITSMPHLQLLDLSRNCLEGEIPPAITNLSNLQSINMSYNCLSGKIPTEIGSMPNLFTLVLSFNNLSGEIPAGIVAASSLLELNLASNRLVGGIPRRITEIAGLTDLNLAWNFLEGSIPPGPWSTETQRVDLSNNRLNGIFPFELLTKNLKFLNLSSNFLTGGIRLFGRDASDAYINLQSTKPEDMQLETLDLSNNLLQGDMSAMLLEKLPRLKELRLRDNMLWGDIPVGPRIWTGLQILDVSHNSMNLSATRKDTTLQIIFDTYTTLGELRLSNNVATGTLPSSSSKLHMLEVLDLSNSNLTGNLTEAFPIFTGAYLPALKVVNLSNNRLWGEIPPGFSEMLNLAYLDLSNNNLSGPVPELPNLKVNVSFFFSGGNRGLCSAPGLKPCPLPGKAVPWSILIVVGASILVSALSFLVLVWRWRAYSKKHQQDADLIAQLLDRDTATTLMSLQDLRRATNNFSESCRIGEGGFGLVYKGVLEDGTTVAIKRGKREATAEHKLQFLNEVKILSQVHHRNLVKLLGCCLEMKIALLVFEYVPNGTLEEHLRWKRPGTLEEHLQCKGSHQHAPLSWRQRLRVAVQTADALAYLHTSASPPIYHLDVKSANVLLDEKLNAKVTDFGISKLAPALDATHITAQKIQGTVGYMDPNYFSTYHVTGKSDVFAFGVVLLELISAQAAVDRSRGDKEEIILSSMAIRVIDSGEFRKLVDPALYDTLESGSEFQSIWEVAGLAIRCLKGDPRERPSMTEVLSELLALWHQLDYTSELQSDSSAASSSSESPTMDGTIYPLPSHCKPPFTHPATGPDSQIALRDSDTPNRNVFTV